MLCIGVADPSTLTMLYMGSSNVCGGVLCGRRDGKGSSSVTIILHVRGDNYRTVR